VGSSAPFPYAGEAAALASSALWAGAGIVFRRLKGRVSASGMNFAKNGTAAVCFAVVALAATGSIWPTEMPLSAQACLAASGLLGLTICDTFFLRAILEIGPRRAGVVMTLAPVLVFVGALFPPFAQVDRAGSPWPWVGLCLALSGIAVASSEAPLGRVDPALRRRGWRDALLAPVFQAGGVLLARMGFQEGADPLGGAYVRLAAGWAGLVVLGTTVGLLGGWVSSLRSRGTLVPLASAAFFGTFLGIGLNQCGIAWAESTGVATTINQLSPVWLIPLSAWFLGERHTVRGWLSTLVALAGVALLAF
jgi:drug/metabolite transporter (DMT)-like permease